MSAADNPNEKLEALGKMTEETENANPSQADQQAEQAEQTKASAADLSAKQWGMLMYTIGGFAQMIAPELKAVYSEDRCFAWGQQATAVAEKYGWNGPSNMPELALLASTAGFAIPTYLLMKASIKTAQAGTSPTSLAAKIGIWWRTRKAKAKIMTPAPAPAAGGNDGRE